MRIALFGVDDTQAKPIRETLATIGHSSQRVEDLAQLAEREREDGFDLLVVNLAVDNDAEISALSPAELPASGLPMLLIASRSHRDAVAAAMQHGVRDYLLMPLRRTELATRVQVLLLRAYPENANTEPIRFGRYLFNIDMTEICVDGRPVSVTQKEFELALLLFRHMGRPLSRAYIRETVWPRDGDLPSRTMDTHVSRVRNKLQLRPENGFRLAPVYSYGYQLEQLNI